MSTPTRKEMLDHLRNHYGLTISQTMDIVNIPLHPFDMRDDFAKAAVIGLSAKFGSVDVAKRAYQIADAMLKERIK